MESFLITLLIFVGLVILGIAFKKPDLFWPILIVISVGTTGLLIKGYCVIDEYFLLCFLLGFFASVIFKKICLSRRSYNFLEVFHIIIFFLFIVYILIQVVRGFWIWDDFKILRWFIYYLMLGVLALFIILKEPSTVFNSRKASLIISLSAFIYFLSYLLHGLFSEIIRGISWFDLQGVEWSGTAYAMFPIIIAVPAGIFLLRDRVWFYRLLGEVLLGLIVVISFYYSSRVSLLTIFVFFLFMFASFIVKKPKKIMIFTILIVLTLIILVLFVIGSKNVINYQKILFGNRYEAWRQAGGDLDRYIHFRASFDAVDDNWSTLLFGYGIYSHRYVLAPYLQKLVNHYLPGVVVEGITRTEGFTALLVDTGWIGMLLFALNFLLVILKILSAHKLPSLDKIFLLLAVVITFCWLLISNIHDMILLYLLVMPSGLILQLTDNIRVEELMHKKI